MKKKIAIFGAGITGLVAARELARAGHEVDVYEASDHVGGLASTFRSDDGFVYDFGPHYFFTTLAEKLGISKECFPVAYYEDLFVGGRYYRFPFGFIRNPTYCLSAGLATLTRSFHRSPKNVKDFLRIYYGRRFSGEVLAPLIEKWAGFPAEELSLDFASRLLPTNVSYILYSLLKKIRGGVTEDYYKKGRYIVYPRGTIESIFRALVATPNVRVHLNSPLTELRESQRIITAGRAGNHELNADYYLSTVPLLSLWKALRKPSYLEAWSRLRYRGILILFLKIDRPKVLKYLWSWFPESKHRFYRISEAKNALSSMAPEGKTLISVEIGCQMEDPLWNSTEEEVYSAIERDLADLYKLERKEIIGMDLRKNEYAYPVLRRETEEVQRNLGHETPLSNLFIAGRTGMFQYRMLEGCYDGAVKAVSAINATIDGRTVTRPEVEVDEYGRPKWIPE